MTSDVTDRYVMIEGSIAQSNSLWKPLVFETLKASIPQEFLSNIIHLINDDTVVPQFIQRSETMQEGYDFTGENSDREKMYNALQNHFGLFNDETIVTYGDADEMPS
jgi:hypothetical protein